MRCEADLSALAAVARIGEREPRRREGQKKRAKGERGLRWFGARRSALWTVAAACVVSFGGCAREPGGEADLVKGPVGSEKKVLMPSPDRGRMLDAVRGNDACVGCHADIAEQWQGSLHQRADIEPAYRRSFEIEPLPFCRACHAPEAIATEEEPEAVAHLGVGCVTCHVVDGHAALAAPANAAGTGLAADERAPHAVSRSAAFAGPKACEGCHEFRFPLMTTGGAESFMQTTHAEHAASPAASRSCADCHMPRDASGKRSHRFAASRDPELVRSAAKIEARRTSEGRVVITLTPVDPGHAFPTGDLFRRIEVRAEVEGSSGAPDAKVTRYLARHWGFRPGETARVLLFDDRLRAEPLFVELDLGEAARDRDVVWRVAYQRVAHPVGLDEADAAIEGEIVLASGRLPRQAKAPGP